MSAFEEHEQQVDRRDASLAADGGAVEGEARERVAHALVGDGVDLVELERLEEGIDCFDQVVVQFEAAPEYELRKCVAYALGNKGCALIDLERYTDAEVVFDELVARFSDAPGSIYARPTTPAGRCVGFSEQLVHL
jgi:tetratricopeptide (TPR) repeat protein